METAEKLLGDCRLAYLEKTFGLRQIRKMSVMDEWLQKAKLTKSSEKEVAFLSLLQELLILNASWNEQELSLHFIGPIFSLVNFTEPYQFNLFAERFIAATVVSEKNEPILLSGKPDEFIASGYREPELPYFCFNEFKKETEMKGDPAGQALAAMLVGQTLNENRTPLYGCYVIGRDWYFMSLQGKQYCISQGYDATTEHITSIFCILKELKEIIRQLTS